MRHEPIEFGWMETTTGGRGSRRAMRNAHHSVPRAKHTAPAPAVEVVDEAFAGFTQTPRRPLEEGLIAKLSAQLEALDRQRDQLSQLLRSIDVESFSK